MPVCAIELHVLLIGWCVLDMIQHLTVANIGQVQKTIWLHNLAEIQHTGYDFSSILPLPLLPRSDNFTSPDADGFFFTCSPAALYSISSAGRVVSELPPDAGVNDFLPIVGVH